MDEISASLLGSGFGSAANFGSNLLSYRLQQQLNKQKYEDMISYAKQNGATPTSIISGITGNAGGVVPSASTSNNPVSDFGQSITAAVGANAQQKQAAAAQDQADAALTNAETERQLGLMKLRLEPQKYFADIQKSLAEAMENTKRAFLHGSMQQYYKELTEDIKQVRPWKISQLMQSLKNSIADYHKIVQETKTSRALQSQYETQADLNVANKNLSWQQSYNEGLKGYRQQWENDLLSAGIDPNRGFWENTGRLMETNPKLFTERMEMFVSALNSIDGKLQENLGKHYKRNAMIGYVLYKGNQVHQKNANSRIWRAAQMLRAISSFIPLSGGSVPDMSTKGVDWWLKD